MRFRTGPRAARCSIPEIIRRRSGAASTRARSPSSSRAAMRRAHEGRLYGIGYTAVVEPSVSNMGYITTVLTPAERRKAGPKNGAQATATVAIDPVGSVTRARRLGAARAGPSHRSVAGRCRRLRSEACRYQGQYRNRYGQGRLVDRVRQLRQPFRSGRCRHRQARRRAYCETAGAYRREPVEYRESTISHSPAAMSDRSAIPTTRYRSLVSQGSATGRRPRCPMASDRRSAKPCSGARRN